MLCINQNIKKIYSLGCAAHRAHYANLQHIWMFQKNGNLLKQKQIKGIEEWALWIWCINTHGYWSDIPTKTCCKLCMKKTVNIPIELPRLKQNSYTNHQWQYQAHHEDCNATQKTNVLNVHSCLNQIKTTEKKSRRSGLL